MNKEKEGERVRKRSTNKTSKIEVQSNIQCLIITRAYNTNVKDNFGYRKNKYVFDHGGALELPQFVQLLYSVR